MKKEALTDWITHYLKSKDAITKSIQDLHKNKDGYDLVVHHTDKDQYVLVLPELTDLADIEKKCDNKNILVVVANSKKNLSFVLKHWLRLATHKRLCLVFVNPKSITEQRWIIYPHTHNAIAEKAALKKGLEALFATVEEAY